MVQRLLSFSPSNSGPRPSELLCMHSLPRLFPAVGFFYLFLLSRIVCLEDSFYCACFSYKIIWMVYWRCWSLAVGIHRFVKRFIEMELLRLLAMTCLLLRSRRCRNVRKLRDINWSMFWKLRDSLAKTGSCWT